MKIYHDEIEYKLYITPLYGCEKSHEGKSLSFSSTKVSFDSI